MAMISPALEAFTESLSTLKFANRAKHIKNSARVNEDLDQKSLLRKYERELKRLRQGLSLVHLSAQRKHFLSDVLGTFSRQMGHNSSQTGHKTAH